MAYRKVNDTSLSSVADAIREKGGTSDALAFPDGFVSAISAIQTGGGGGGDTLLGYNLLSGTITLAEESTDPIKLVDGMKLDIYNTYCFCALWSSNTMIQDTEDYNFVGVSALTGAISYGMTSKGSNLFKYKMLWPSNNGLTLYSDSTYKLKPGTTYCWIMLYKT